MDCIAGLLLLLLLLLAPSFNCEEATANSLEVISSGGGIISEEPIYIPPLNLDVEPFTMRLDLE